MEIERAKYISDLAIRYYIIRERIKKLRNSVKSCNEVRLVSLANDPDGFELPLSNQPCYILYHQGKYGRSRDPDECYINKEDMCKECKERERIRDKVNKLSLEGAALKRKFTWKLKKEIKENNKKEIPIMYETSDLLFELITG